MVQAVDDFDIFVQTAPPPNLKFDLFNQTDIGNWTNPFFNIQDALIRAQELAAPYAINVTININIHLFAGNHFVIDSRGSTRLYYKPIQYKNGDNQNYNLKIQPLRCELQRSYINQMPPQNCISISSSSNVVIYNKQRENFRLTVSQSLILDHITIDSIDSILQSNKTSYSSIPCINERRQCCQIDPITSQIVNVFQSDTLVFDCGIIFRQLVNTMEFDCFANWPRSLFQMKLSDSRLLQAQNQLVLTSCEIRNIFYAMNSLVSLTPAQGIVQFLNTNFNNISICGGLVKTSFQNLGKPEIQNFVTNQFLTEKQVSKIVEVWGFQDFYKVNPTQSYYGEVPSQTNPACAITNTCFSIIINNCNFLNIPFGYNYLTTPRTLLVSENNGLRNLGKIVTMESITGSAQVINSKFTSLIENYDGCNTSYTLFNPQPISSLNNFRQLFNASKGGFTSYQIKSLFSFKKHTGDLTFTGNQVSNCLTYKGVFDVDLSSPSSAFVMSQNQFTKNSALIDANILSFQRTVDQTQSDCGSAQFSSNQFSQNIGCSETNGVAYLYCKDSTSAYINSTDTYYTSETDKMTRINAFSGGTDLKSGVKLNLNIIKNNYAGTNKSIFNIQGFPTVYFDSNTINSNENWSPINFKNYSQIYSLQSNQLYPVQPTSIQEFTTRAKSIITVRGSNYLSLNGDTYNSNYVFDEWTPSVCSPAYQSNALSIFQSTGTLSMTNVSFKSHVGITSSLIYQGIIGQKYGFKTTLIALNSVQFSQLTFDQMTFSGNIGYVYTDQKQAPMPQLFKLTQDMFKITLLMINDLNLSNNVFIGADSLVSFKIATPQSLNSSEASSIAAVLFKNLQATSNSANSIILLEFLDDGAKYQVQNSNFTKNFVDSGAVFKTKEVSGFQRFNTNPKPGDALLYNLQFQACTFTENHRDQDLVNINRDHKTSCIEIIGGFLNWMTLNIAGCVFKNNIGYLTNEIFFDQSLRSFNATANSWTIDVSNQSLQKLAQVIYKPADSLTQISISGSSFTCTNNYDSKIIMQVNEAMTFGRPALFHIEQNSTFQVMQELSNKCPSTSPQICPGMLDASQFNVQFSANTYTYCNNFYKGSVFYVSDGGQVRDKGSTFQYLSALMGGIGFVTGDGSYLHIESQDQPLTISQIRAHQGGVAFVQYGATTVLRQSLTFSQITVNEGVLAFVQNRGRLVINERVTISENIMNRRGIVVALNAAQFWIANTTITDNIANEDSAIIYVSENHRHNINYYPTSNGGLQNIFEYSLVKKTTIQMFGRLITVIDSNLIIKQVNFQSNDQIYDESYGIQILSSVVSIINCKFQGPISTSVMTKLSPSNIKDVYGGFLQIQDNSDVNVKATTFSTARAILGGCVMLTNGSKATFDSQCSFTQCAANQGGAIYAEGHQSLYVANSNFTGNFAYLGKGTNIYSVNCAQTFTINAVNFDSYYNSIYTSGLELYVSSIVMTAQKGPPPPSVQPAPYYTDGGGFYIKDTLTVNFTQTNTFTGLKARNGGAIYMNNNLVALAAYTQLSQTTGNDKNKIVPKAQFSGMVIDGCTALQDGGAFYLVDPIAMTIDGGNNHPTIIKNCIAGLNTSSDFPKGDGGAIYYDCKIKENPTKTLNTNQFQCGLNFNKKITFQNNIATNGGAIRWTYKEPNFGQSDILRKNDTTSSIPFGNVAFQNNTATVYGPEIAGVTQRLIKFSNESQYLDYYNQSSTIKQWPIRNPDIIKWYGNDMILDIQSGGYIPARYYGLVDKYNQIVSTNKGSQISLSLTDRSTINNQTNFITGLFGVTSFYSAYGTFNMSAIMLLTGPGTSIQPKLQIQAVDVTIPSNVQYLQQNLGKLVSNSSDYFIKFNLTVRNCRVGEGLTAQGACFPCPAGTFLLKVPENATDCESCPKEEAFCDGGANIYPRPGFWRASNLSDIFYKCPLNASCIGGFNITSVPNLTQTALSVGVCNTTAGYYGVLCSGCLPGFKRDGLTSCKKCSQKYEKYLTLAQPIVFIIIIVLFVGLTIDGAEKETMQSIYFKVLFNHWQMLIIFASFQMQWPKNVIKIFDVAYPIRLLTTAVTSFDCFMDTRQNVDPYYFQYRSNDFPIIYMKLCILAALPIIIIIMSYISWSIILRIKNNKGKDELYIKGYSTVIILFFIIHPSITQSMVNMFNCQEYEDYDAVGNKTITRRLVIDLQVMCWQDKWHKTFTLYLALPCIIIYGLGIPAMIFVMMKKESGRLETLAVKQQFGFFYNGFKRNSYFWEIVIMYRKVVCIFIAVLAKGKGIILQAVLMLLTLLFFSQVNSTRRPYLNRALNDIENLSIMTQLITIFCGIFFISAKDKNSGNFDTHVDFYLDPLTQWIFFGIIAISNLFFFIYWILYLVNEFKDNLMSEFPDIYTKICLWGRIDRWKYEVYKRAQNKKKEAIIQNIENVTLFLNEMKDIYIKDIFYEDHKRFLKLLYYISSEKLQINLSQKKHNYYIQGDMARDRLFDRERQKDIKDERTLDVDGQEVIVDQMERMRPKKKKTFNLPKNPFLSTLIKLKRMKIDKEEDQIRREEDETALKIQEAEAQARKLTKKFLDEESQRSMSQKWSSSKRKQAGMKSLLGTNISKVESFRDQFFDEGSPKFHPAQLEQGDNLSSLFEEDYLSGTGNDDDESKSKITSSPKKKKKKKADVPDLQANVYKSRNLKNAIRKERKHRYKQTDFNLQDGSLKPPELPTSLQGFSHGYEKTELGDNQIPDPSKLQFVFDSIDSVERNLIYIRHLTERLEKEAEEDKQIQHDNLNEMVQDVDNSNVSFEQPDQQQTPVQNPSINPAKQNENQESEALIQVQNEKDDIEKALLLKENDSKVHSSPTPLSLKIAETPQNQTQTQKIDNVDEKAGTRLRPPNFPRRFLANMIFVEDQRVDSSGSYEDLTDLQPDASPQKDQKIVKQGQQMSIPLKTSQSNQQKLNENAAALYYKKKTKGSNIPDAPIQYPVRVKKDKPNHMLQVSIFNQNGQINLPRLKYTDQRLDLSDPSPQKPQEEEDSFHTDPSMRDYDETTTEPGEFRYINKDYYLQPKVQTALKKTDMPAPITEASEKQESFQDEEEKFIDMEDGLSGGFTEFNGNQLNTNQRIRKTSNIPTDPKPKLLVSGWIHGK